jgi:hypothetical protein
MTVACWRSQEVSMTKFILSSNPANLSSALALATSSGTIEAEYGSVTVSGSAFTWAHHGLNAGNLAPCSYISSPAVECVGLSHVDLDTLGGCLAVLGRKRAQDGSFWVLAEFVDLNGAHKLQESKASAQDIARLHAFWAWSEGAGRVFPPRDGSCLDVTEKVLAGCLVIEKVLNDDPDLLAAGEVFRLAGEALASESFRGVKEVAGLRIILRESEKFTNHIYAHQGVVCDAVIARNSKLDSLTLSFSDGQGDACAVMQRAFGPLAGGHKGIAGTPRDQKFTSFDIERVIEAMASL